MKIVLIRITAGGVAGGDYTVELFSDDNSDDWLQRRLAWERVPADLTATEAPAVVRDGAGSLDERVRRYVSDNRQSGLFGAIGDHLAGLLLRGEVASEWDTLRANHPEGLRTLLQIEPEHLRMLPWELMSREGRLFVDPSCVFVRVRQFVDDQRQELAPIRLLVVEGQRDDQLGTRSEVRAIKRVLPQFAGGIEAEFLTGPSEPELMAAYARVRPHIFHFIGHGERQPGTSDPALRIVDRNTRTKWLLTRQYIQDLLRPTPRVAVLNACRSGDLDGVRALTDTFVDRGAAAVIGMQGDIQGQAAAQFGGELYQALARGQLIDQAVTTARAAVYAAVGVARQERDWFLPSLTLRVRPEQVLPVIYGISQAERQRIESNLFRTIQVFVDRIKERGQLVTGVDPDNGVPPGRLLVVEGDLLAGKTWLLQWIRTRCALRGRRVKYVDFRGKESLDFLPALCAIRDTPEDVPALVAPAGAFDRFNYDLGFLVRGQLPEEPVGEVPRVDPPSPDTELQAGPVDTVDRIFESFREALDGATTATSPLVLILDHLDGLLKTAFQNFLYPLLIRKVAVEGELPNVRVVVVLSPEQRRDYWPAGDTNVGERVNVDLIPADQYSELAEDLVLAMGEEICSEHERLIDALAPFIVGREPGKWRLEKLLNIQRLAGRR